MQGQINLQCDELLVELKQMNQFGKWFLRYNEY